jgi:hypothetical protein
MGTNNWLLRFSEWYNEKYFRRAYSTKGAIYGFLFALVVWIVWRVLP